VVVPQVVPQVAFQNGLAQGVEVTTPQGRQVIVWEAINQNEVWVIDTRNTQRIRVPYLGLVPTNRPIMQGGRWASGQAVTVTRPLGPQQGYVIDYFNNNPQVVYVIIGTQVSMLASSKVT
jgi:hypothetical protein